ncbi:MAG: DUF2271 domain-containing protein [Treponema sp.]|nr:DUF2271 domain-containing protein [Treponema sp.]
MRNRANLYAAALIFAVLPGLAAAQTTPFPRPPASSPVLTLDYTRQTGYASNQFALWLEDVKGNFIKTLFVTDYTGKQRGWRTRPQNMPEWQKKSDIKNRVVDIASGATPKTGTLRFEIPFRDNKNAPLPPGIYRICLEANLRNTNMVRFYADLDLYASNAYDTKIDLIPVYSPPEASQSPEAGMVTNVRLVYNLR